MLNKKQSKKWNSLKYALVIPVLIAFVFAFQMEVIAKEKRQNQKIEQSTSNSNDSEIYKIDKNTTDAELKEKAETISKNYGVTVHFSKTKRNANNELIAIAVEIKKGKEIAENRTVKSSDPIKAFVIIISKDENGKLDVGFAEGNNSDNKIIIRKAMVNSHPNISADTQIIIDDEKADKEQMEKIAPEDIVRMDITNNAFKKEIRITTKTHTINGNGEEFFINGEKVDANTFNQVDADVTNRVEVNTDANNTIHITTKDFNFQFDKDAPKPPVPPAPPVIKFKAPAPPAIPKAPKAPKGNPNTGDKKAWEDFEKKMEEFDAKMKKMQPQMEEFDKQMADFDKQMKPYEKEMKEYEEKMKVYQKEMEKYLTEKKKNKS